jgi:hypothetical protein
MSLDCKLQMFDYIFGKKINIYVALVLLFVVIVGLRLGDESIAKAYQTKSARSLLILG